MTTCAEVIRAAIPDASDELVSFVLWERTPYPFSKQARLLYKLASGTRRAAANHITLCELCSNRAVDNWLCERCAHWAEGSLSPSSGG